MRYGTLKVYKQSNPNELAFIFVILDNTPHTLTIEQRYYYYPDPAWNIASPPIYARLAINLNSAQINIGTNDVKYKTRKPGDFSYYGMSWPASAASLLFTEHNVTPLGLVHEMAHNLGGAGDNDGYLNWKGTKTCLQMYGDMVPIITDTGLVYIDYGDEFCSQHILYLRRCNFWHGISSTPTPPVP
jgi:hypothetical protein